MKEPGLFRKRATIARAMQWTADNGDAITEWVGAATFQSFDEDDHWEEDPSATAAVRDDTRGGTWQPLKTGDWIVQGRGNHLQPCGEEEFEQLYEPLEADPG